MALLRSNHKLSKKYLYGVGSINFSKLMELREVLERIKNLRGLGTGPLLYKK